MQSKTEFVLDWPKLQLPPDPPTLMTVDQLLLTCSTATKQVETKQRGQSKSAKARQNKSNKEVVDVNQQMDIYEAELAKLDPALNIRASVVLDTLREPRDDGLGIAIDQCSSTKMLLPMITPAADLQPAHISNKMALLADAVGSLINSIPMATTAATSHGPISRHKTKHSLKPRVDVPLLKQRLGKIHETMCVLTNIINERIDCDLETISSVIRHPEVCGDDTFFVSPDRRGNVDRVGLVGQTVHKKKPQ